MNRNVGFHWVKYIGEWRVAQWDGADWSIPNVWYYIEDFDLEAIGKQVVMVDENGDS